MPRTTRRLAVAGATALTVLAGLLGVAVPASSAAAAEHPAASVRTASSTAVATSSSPATVAPPGADGTVVPLPGYRLLDTRFRTGGAGPVTAAHPVVTFPVLGRGGLPTSGVGSVMLTVTVTGPTAAGYVGHDGLSSLNFAAGQTIAHLVVVPVAADGTVSLTVVSPGTTQLVADLTGYVRSGVTQMSGSLSFWQLPVRVADTRPALVAPGRSLAVDLRPWTDQMPVEAGVLLNLTVTRTAAAGYLTIHADGAHDPTTSALNFAAGQTVANAALVRSAADGVVVVTNHSPGSVAVVLDLDGLVRAGGPSADGATVALAPTRLLDTRHGLAAPGPVPARTTVRLRVAGAGGVPLSGISAVVLNLTATAATAAGFVTAYADGTPTPPTSVLDYRLGQTVADTVVVPVGADGTVDLTTAGSGSVQLLADVEGYLHAARTPTLTWSVPAGGTTVDDGLRQVSCATRTFCMAAVPGYLSGWVGTAFRTFDGSTWSQPVAAPFQFDAWDQLSCPSPSLCVMNDGSGGVWTWDGQGWTQAAIAPITPGESQAFFEISCPSATFCMAVDEYGRYVTWDGASWTSATSAPAIGDAQTLSCASPTFCLVTGRPGIQDAIFDGSTWRHVPSGTTRRYVRALSCASPTYCVGLTPSFSTGAGPEAVVFDGTSWGAALPVPLPAGSGLPVVQCLAVARCVADYASYPSVVPGDSVATLTPSGWSATDLDPSSDGAQHDGMQGISCVATDWCVATDYVGRAFVLDQGTWSATTSPPLRTGDFDAVACPDGSFCVVVTGLGSVLTGDGTTWSAPDHVAPGRRLTQVSCASRSFCVAVDDNGGVITWDGRAWAGDRVVDPGRVLTSISCSAPGSCLASDSAGDAILDVGGSWGKPTALPSGGTLSDVSCLSPAYCVGASQYRVVIDRDGRWQDGGIAQNSPSPVSCSATLCLAEGTGSDLFTLGPGRPAALFLDVGMVGSALSCSHAGLCIDSLDTSVAGDLDGSPWSLPSSPPTRNETDDFDSTPVVACADPGMCVAASPGLLAVAHLG